MLLVKRMVSLIIVTFWLTSTVSGSDDRQATVIVNALDDHGIPVRSLSLGDFKFSSRKHEIQPVNLRFSEGPRRVVILMDISGSMFDHVGDSRWEVARDAAIELANAIPPGTMLSLLTFATNAEERAAMTSDRQQILASLSNLKPNMEKKNGKGRTALFDGLLAALKSLDPPQVGDAIVVVTDGGKNASKTRYSEIAKALRAQSGVRLFACLLVNWPTELDEAGREALVQMVNDSGGGTMDITAPSAYPENMAYGRRPTLVFNDQIKSLIKDSANALSSEISGFYLLTLKVPEGRSGSSGWKLELAGERGKRRDDITLAYPGHTDAIWKSPNHGMPVMPDAPQKGPN